MPRLTVQELLSDNTLEVRAPRRFDAITVVAPGISILANTARLQLNLDYQPNLLLHAINGPLNVITQQLNAVGLLTVVPDLAYVDFRAVSGVQSRVGALTGAGTLGAGGVGANTAPAGTGQGLNRNNEVQSSSAGISPYLLRQLGDYGTAKVGVSGDISRYNSISGFISSPFPSGGTNGSTLLSTEQVIHYSSGQILQKLQYSFDADASQSHTQTDALTSVAGSAITTAPGTSFSSERETVNNQISYAVSHNFTLLASAGVQRIQYGVANFPSVNGLIWNAGFTYAPTPDSSVTMSYGRSNGTNSLTANGHLAIGGRSLLSFDYSNTVGTQLENLRNQLNNSAIGPNGTLNNAQTGGPNFVAQNATGVQNGVFRFNTFNASFSTTWLRDSLQATLTWSEQTSITPTLAQSFLTTDPQSGALVILTVPASAAGNATVYSTIGFVWNHDVSPDLQFNSTASYTFVRRNSTQGNDSVLSAAIGLQYTLSPSTSLSARYSFFDRVSRLPGYSLYENIIVLGVTKQF